MVPRRWSNAGPWVSLGVSQNKKNRTSGRGVIYTSCAVKYYPTRKWYDEADVGKIVVYIVHSGLVYRPVGYIGEKLSI